MRGRNRNKGPNPLTRTYESNGPDVKIRGTAQHVADKYAQLARDAQASGDPVAAENYLQHAEHYYRIIATAQEQFRDQFGGSFQQRPFDEDGDEEAGGSVNGHAYSPAAQDEGDGGAQPQPYENRGENGERGERPQRFDRNERFDRGDRQDRGERQERFGNRQDRDNNRRDRFQRGDRQDFQRPDSQRQDRDNRRERRPETGDEQPGGLPAFLTAPVRQPISVDDAGGDADAPNPGFAPENGDETNGRYGARNPRRRRRSRYGNGQGEEGSAEPGADFASEGAEPPVE